MSVQIVRSFSWNKDRIAALLFVPYAAWVCFAMALNAALLSPELTMLRCSKIRCAQTAFLR